MNDFDKVMEGASQADRDRASAVFHGMLAGDPQSFPMQFALVTKEGIKALAAAQKKLDEAPQRIEEAVQASARAASERAQAAVNQAVAGLVPTISEGVNKAAATAVRRVHLGRSLFSIYAAILTVSLAFALGLLYGSRIMAGFERKTITIEAFWELMAWGVGAGIASPLLIIVGREIEREGGAGVWAWLSIVAGALLAMVIFIRMFFA